MLCSSLKWTNWEGKMTEQEIERCLERFTIGKATDVMNFDYSGTLAYLQRLKAENDALRERLSRAVELPCKVGDTIFYVQYFCDYKGCDSTTQQFCCGCKEMIEREKHKEKYVICEKSFVLKDLEKIGKKYFTTREAAEARLARKVEEI